VSKIGKHPASEVAEKLDLARDFGWRSAGVPGGQVLARWDGALQRCDNRLVLSATLAAEVTFLAEKRLFPQPPRPCRRIAENELALLPLRAPFLGLDEFLRKLFSRAANSQKESTA